MSTRTALAIGVAVLWGLAWGVPAHAFSEQMEQGAERTIIGEVVDLGTLLREGERGTSEQVYEAVDGGQSLALVEESGALYLFLGEQFGEDPNELAVEYINQKVKVTGKVYARGGLKGIVARAVKPLELVPAPDNPTP